MRRSRIKPKAAYRAIQIRVFECEECKTKRVATKRYGRTYPGHIKHMYCFTCNKATDFVQVE